MLRSATIREARALHKLAAMHGDAVGSEMIVVDVALREANLKPLSIGEVQALGLSRTRQQKRRLWAPDGKAV